MKQPSTIFAAAMVFLIGCGGIKTDENQTNRTFFSNSRNSGSSAKLEGTWKLVGVESEVRSPESFNIDHMVFDGQNIVSYQDGEVRGSGGYLVDTSVKPHAITLYSNATKSDIYQSGLCELRGKTFRMCLSKNAKSPAPTNFVVDKENKSSLFKLERVPDSESLRSVADLKEPLTARVKEMIQTVKAKDVEKFIDEYAHPDHASSPDDVEEIRNFINDNPQELIGKLQKAIQNINTLTYLSESWVVTYEQTKKRQIRFREQDGKWLIYSSN